MSAHAWQLISAGGGNGPLIPALIVGTPDAFSSSSSSFFCYLRCIFAWFLTHFKMVFKLFIFSASLYRIFLMISRFLPLFSCTSHLQCDILSAVGELRLHCARGMQCAYTTSYITITYEITFTEIITYSRSDGSMFSVVIDARCRYHQRQLHAQ